MWDTWCSKSPKITQNHQITINTLFWKSPIVLVFRRCIIDTSPKSPSHVPFCDFDMWVCLAWLTFVSRTIGILTNVRHLMLKITQNHPKSPNHHKYALLETTLVFRRCIIDTSPKSPSHVPFCDFWYVSMSCMGHVSLSTDKYIRKRVPCKTYSPKITQNHQNTINTLFWKPH